jgi:putative endonuclease
MARLTESWFCYILKCCDDSFYVGTAKDPVQRAKRHNQGFGAKHTWLRRPVQLVWQEEYSCEAAARNREAEAKGWQREKKLKLIASNGIHPSPERRAQGEFSNLRLENSGE